MKTINYQSAFEPTMFERILGALWFLTKMAAAMFTAFAIAMFISVLVMI